MTCVRIHLHGADQFHTCHSQPPGFHRRTTGNTLNDLLRALCLEANPFIDHGGRDFTKPV